MESKGIQYLIESLQAIGILPIDLENFTIYQNIINEAVEIDQQTACPICKTTEAEAIQNKEICGFDTEVACSAYNLGREHEQLMLEKHLEEMDFNNPPNSKIGQLIKEKLAPPF